MARLLRANRTSRVCITSC